MLFAADGTPTAQNQPDRSEEPPILAEARMRLQHLISGAKVFALDLDQRQEAVLDLLRSQIEMPDGGCELSLCLWGARFDLKDQIKVRDAADNEKLIGFLASMFERFTRLLDQYRTHASHPN